jgi:hypothetical protein
LTYSYRHQQLPGKAEKEHSEKKILSCYKHIRGEIYTSQVILSTKKQGYSQAVQGLSSMWKIFVFQNQGPD